MQKRQTVPGSYRRWHFFTGVIFSVVIVSLLLACGTADTGGRPATQSIATRTPTTQALAHLTVYVTADNGILRAVKADSGQVRWQEQTGQIAGGRPVVENGIVYAGSQDTVYAFKASDGTLLWSAQGFNPPTGPLVASGKVFVDYYTTEPDGSVTLSVAALRGTDGSRLWSKQIVTHSTLPMPTPGTLGQLVANGVFYAAVLSALNTDTQPARFLLYAFNANDGQLLWHSSGTFAQGEYAMLLVDNGVVFAYMDRLSAYKASDGTLLWQSKGASQPLSGPNGAYNDLLVAQGGAYAVTTGGLTAYSTENGSQFWHVSTDSSQGQFTEMTLANGVIYATQTDGASALDVRTGKLLWSYKANQQFAGFFAPLTDGNTLYISNFVNGLVALDRHTGEPRWQNQVGGNGIRPTLIAGTVFVGGGDGVIAAIRASDNRLLWRIPTHGGMSFPSALIVV
jgi:outer membrane protein assembly factor BamB